MKGITGHRVLDAYANMALSPVRKARTEGQDVAAPQRSQDAASVSISDGARLLAQGQAADPVRVSALQEKVAHGPGAFDRGVVASRLVGELTG